MDEVLALEKLIPEIRNGFAGKDREGSQLFLSLLFAVDNAVHPSGDASNGSCG